MTKERKPKYTSFLKFTLVALLLFTAGCHAGPSRGASKSRPWRDSKYRQERRARISMAQGVENSQYGQFKKDLALLMKRNPFSPPVLEVEATGRKLKLECIIQSETVPAAIINDNIVNEGDTVGGMVVKEIGETSVILLKDGEEYKLELRFE